MADWIIPCNPEYYDIAGSFEKLESVDWRQSVTGIIPGDTVCIYVSKPVQAIAFSYVVMDTMIPTDKADFSDAEFEKGNSLEPYFRYMRLKPVCRIPLNALTLDRMHRAGLKGNIQGPMRVPEELKNLFEAAQQVSELKNPAESICQEMSGSIMDDSRNNNTEVYDIEKFMKDLKIESGNGSRFSRWFLQNDEGYSNSIQPPAELF